MRIRSLLVFLVFVCLFATALPSEAKGSRRSYSRSRTHSSRTYSHRRAASQPRRSRAATGVARDARGRIARSEEAKRTFMRQTGYPHGRPGYVVDHITPLACGGADAPSNMQWQTAADAKAKDRVERKGC